MTQKKSSDNGNNVSADNAIQNAEIEFPVTFELKAVIDASDSDDDNKKKLTGVFNKMEVTNSYIGNKKSSKGTYVSYNYKVTFQNKEQMEKLYTELKSVPGLKFAI